MKLTHLLAAVALLGTAVARSAEPLRVFIQSGKKTHAPGLHEHPQFLADWVKLLNARGAKCAGGAEFPSDEELARTDVVLIYTADGGDLDAGRRAALGKFLARGGGLVTVLDGVCSHDPHWWKTVTGVAWEYNRTRWVYAKLTLRFRDAEHPVSAGAADFALDDEVYDGLHVVPEAKVLAESEFTPPKSEPGAKPKSVPQVWALEKDGYRAFTSIPGLRLTTFSVPAYRALLLRGIAWAGRREQIAEFCTPDETAALQGRGTGR